MRCRPPSANAYEMVLVSASSSARLNLWATGSGIFRSRQKRATCSAARGTSGSAFNTAKDSVSLLTAACRSCNCGAPNQAVGDHVSMFEAEIDTLRGAAGLGRDPRRLAADHHDA